MMTRSGKKTVPVIDGVFTLPPDDVRLIGAKCRDCGAVAFPESVIRHRPGCRENYVRKTLLPKNGVLKSYTIQRYQPPPIFACPQPFEPYIIGSVAVDDGLEIAGVVTGCGLDDVRVGMQMEVTLYALYRDEEGNDVVTYAFSPVS